MGSGSTGGRGERGVALQGPQCMMASCNASVSRRTVLRDALPSKDRSDRMLQRLLRRSAALASIYDLYRRRN